MVYYVIPSKRVFFFWIYAGIGLTAYYFPLKFPEGLGPQPPDFVFEYLCRFIVLVVLIPIEEELLCRGLLYGAIRTKYGKFKAYVISILIFVFSHRRLWPYIIEGYWDLFFLHLIILTVLACFLTYLYESKRSLLLCMAFHSSANFNLTITPLIGFLYGGYIVSKWFLNFSKSVEKVSNSSLKRKRFTSANATLSESDIQTQCHWSLGFQCFSTDSPNNQCLNASSRPVDEGRRLKMDWASRRAGRSSAAAQARITASFHPWKRDPCKRSLSQA